LDLGNGRIVIATEARDGIHRLSFWPTGDVDAGARAGRMPVRQRLAAHPNNEAIRAAVKRHKDEIRTTLGRRAGRPQRANDIFLLHENACRHRWLLATLRRSRSGIWAVAAWPPTLHCAGPFLVGTGSVWRGW
jgi:hypothetical protein